jgi:hypothetical protein
VGERLCAGVGGALGASAGGARLGQQAAAAGDAERCQREREPEQRRGRRRQASTEAGLSCAGRVVVFYVGELQREGEIGGQEVQPRGP